MSSKKTDVKESSSTFSRLSTDVVPQVYDVTLVPDLDQFTFQGFVDITILVAKTTAAIELHSLELTYRMDSQGKPMVFVTPLTSNSSSPYQCQSIQLDEKLQTATLVFPSAFTPGKYSLTIQFTGIHNDQLAGFYRSKYTSPDGKAKHMVIIHIII